MNIEKDLNIYNGHLLESKGQRYSSTHIHGNVNNYNNSGFSGNISSTVSHHHKQEIWILTDDGKEECIKLNNINFEAREGHRIQIVRNAHTGKLERIGNINTNTYWRCGPYKFTAFHRELLVAVLIKTMPFVNVFYALRPLKCGSEYQFEGQFDGGIKRKLGFRITALLSTCLLAMYIAIASDSFRPQFSFTVSDQIQAKVFAPVAAVTNIMVSWFIDPEASNTRSYQDLIQGMTIEERTKDIFSLRDKTFQLPSDGSVYLNLMWYVWSLSFLFYFLICSKLVKKVNQYYSVVHKLSL